MNRLLAWTVAAAALPVAGIVAGIALQEHALRDASRWRIPVTGYDPRDPLRGRYIAFRYDWATRGDPALCRDHGACRLCLEEGGAVVRVVRSGVACTAMVDPIKSGLVPNLGDGQRMWAPARLWVSERRAPVIEAQLRRGPMVAITRLTGDGRLVAERLEPASVGNR